MKDLNTINDAELKEIIFVTTGLKPQIIKRSHKIYNMVFNDNTVCSYNIDEIIKLLFKNYTSLKN